MKKLVIMVISALICGVVLTGCSFALRIQDAESFMTLQIEPKDRKMNISLNGFGVVKIDWGDGINTVDTLSGKQKFYRHEYTNYTVRTITIIGENITMLICSYFPLKS